VSRVAFLWLFGVPLVAIGVVVAVFTGFNRAASSEVVITPPADLAAPDPAEPSATAEQTETGIRKIFSKAERMQITHAAINVPQ